MADNKIFVTGKYTSRTGIWQITASRNGRKAIAKGQTMPKTHKAALAALALMEEISSGDKPVADVSVAPKETSP